MVFFFYKKHTENIKPVFLYIFLVVQRKKKSNNHPAALNTKVKHQISNPLLKIVPHKPHLINI